MWEPRTICCTAMILLCGVKDDDVDELYGLNGTSQRFFGISILDVFAFIDFVLSRKPFNEASSRRKLGRWLWIKFGMTQNPSRIALRYENSDKTLVSLHTNEPAVVRTRKEFVFGYRAWAVDKKNNRYGRTGAGWLSWCLPLDPREVWECLHQRAKMVRQFKSIPWDGGT